MIEDTPGFRGSWRTLLTLGRVSNLPTVWSNCFAGWWAADGWQLQRLFWAMLGGTLLYLGGMFLNDAMDVSFDRQHRPERPIPSGHIRLAVVWLWGGGLLVAGILCFGLLGAGPFLWALVLLSAILLYDAVHKVFLFSPLLMGACRFLLVMAAAACSMAGISGYAIWVALVLACYVVGLSYLARDESHPATLKYWPCILLAAPLVLGLVYHRGPDQLRGWCLIALLLAWILLSLRHIYWSDQPNVGRTVSGLLAGIVLVDLLAVGAAGWGPTLFLVGLFVLALFFQRFIPAT